MPRAHRSRGHRLKDITEPVSIFQFGSERFPPLKTISNTNLPHPAIATELQRLHLVTLQGAAGTVQQTTPPTETQHAILAALEIEAPPRITALEPA